MMDVINELKLRWKENCCLGISQPDDPEVASILVFFFFFSFFITIIYYFNYSLCPLILIFFIVLRLHA